VKSCEIDSTTTGRHKIRCSETRIEPSALLNLLKLGVQTYSMETRSEATSSLPTLEFRHGILEYTCEGRVMIIIIYTIVRE